MDRMVCLEVRLKGRVLTGQLLLDAKSFLPTALVVPLAGEVEVWRFDQWEGLPPPKPPLELAVTRSPGEATTSGRCPWPYARSTRHWGAAGGTNEYVAQGTGVERQLVSEAGSAYDMPASVVLPADTTFDSDQGFTVRG